VAKRGKVHFLTAYIEYLFDEGIRSEYVYVSDASRFLRFLLERADTSDVQEFLNSSTSSENYRQRLTGTLTKFFMFANERLGISNNPVRQRKESTRSIPNQNRVS